jgi:hypothetical protein
MSERNTHWRDSITGLYLDNKYWFIGSTIFFLLAASVYLIFTPVTYKVTTRIVLKTNEDPEEIIKSVKSMVLLQKVINQLPLQVVYYQQKAAEETEIPGNSLPVKVVFYNNPIVSSSAELKIYIVNTLEYKILKDRVFMYFLFDEPVNYYSFAKFKIVKGPGFNTNINPSVVRIYSPDHLLQEYRKNLDAKFIGGNNIELSLTANSLKQGRNFLDKLVEVYNTSNNIENAQNMQGKMNPESIQKVRGELALLKSKSANFKTQKVVLLNNKEPSAGNKTLKEKNKKFLNVLNAIEPYAKNNTNQFVLIPYGDEVVDRELQKLISQFNSAQLEKQHELQEPQVDNLKVGVLNTRLLTIKQSIIERIETNKNEISGVQQSPLNTTLAAINDSIIKLKDLISSKQQAYDDLVNIKVNKVEAVSAKPKETIIEKSSEHVITYPKIGYVYLFALLIGMILPLIIPYFKLRVNLW